MSLSHPPLYLLRFVGWNHDSHFKCFKCFKCSLSHESWTTSLETRIRGEIDLWCCRCIISLIAGKPQQVSPLRQEFAQLSYVNMLHHGKRGKSHGRFPSFLVNTMKFAGFSMAMLLFLTYLSGMQSPVSSMIGSFWKAQLFHRISTAATADIRGSKTPNSARSVEWGHHPANSTPNVIRGAW